MSNNNFQIELQEAQQKKIDYFCQIINNNNISQAEYYLNKANWDENLAIQYFYNPDYANNYKQNAQKTSHIQKENYIKRHASAKMKNKNNNDIIDKTYVKREYNKNNKYIQFNIEDITNYKEDKGIHHTHDKTLLYIKNNLKNVEVNFKIFINKLETNAGLILVFNEESLHKVKEQIKQINEINEIFQNYIIFPASSNSEEGIKFIIGLVCVSFPSYIFCKYKDEKNILITDKMEGAFDKYFLLECINKLKSSLKPSSIENNKKSNMKIPPKPEPNKNDQIFNNLLKEFDLPGRKKINLADKNKNKREHRIPNPETYNKNINKNDIKNNKMNLNNKENIIENNKYQNNYENRKINDMNNKIDNINSKIDKNKNNGLNYSNLGDFFLGDSIEIPKLFGLYNNNSKNDLNIDNDIEKHSNINKENKNNDKYDQNILNNNNNNLLNSKESDMMLRDSIYNLSDGQILAKREQEMRRLEKIQEEKEKKEKEEKRKQEEEERKIKKYEKESEIAKMILAPEPDDNNPDACHIKFRLPDGEKIVERKFLKSDKISVLYDYIKSIGRDIFMEPDANDFSIICMGFPPKNLENLKNSTLEKEGLYPNSILQIEEK